MIEKLFDRTELPFPDNKIEIFTDGNGQLIKIREKGRVVDKKEKDNLWESGPR